MSRAERVKIALRSAVHIHVTGARTEIYRFDDVKYLFKLKKAQAIRISKISSSCDSYLS